MLQWLQFQLKMTKMHCKQLVLWRRATLRLQLTLRLHGEVYIYEVKLVTVAKSMNEPTSSCSLFAFSFLHALKKQ